MGSATRWEVDAANMVLVKFEVGNGVVAVSVLTRWQLVVGAHRGEATPWRGTGGGHLKSVTIGYTRRKTSGRWKNWNTIGRQREFLRGWRGLQCSSFPTGHGGCQNVPWDSRIIPAQEFALGASHETGCIRTPRTESPTFVQFTSKLCRYYTNACIWTCAIKSRPRTSS